MLGNGANLQCGVLSSNMSIPIGRGGRGNKLCADPVPLTQGGVLGQVGGVHRGIGRGLFYLNKELEGGAI